MSRMPLARTKRDVQRQARYVEALDRLDDLREQGRVSPNAFELRRARIMAEAVKDPWPASVQLLVGFATVVVVLLILGLVLRFVGAVAGG